MFTDGRAGGGVAGGAGGAHGNQRQPRTTQVYERFLDAVDAGDAQDIAVSRGITLDSGDRFFDLLNPPYARGAAFAGDWDANSLVLRLDVGQVACLFTSDASNVNLFKGAGPS